MDVKRILSLLTKEEKAALVAGTDFMYTNPIPNLDIPSIRMADGPHGVRTQNSTKPGDVSGSDPATCFPTAATTASSWNPENTYKMGKAMAREAQHYGVSVILGPGVNIKRNPLAGRNFEYFSEDPFLAGKMAVGEVSGIESEGVGVSVKHFALNNSENYRLMGDSIADMRAIREIYLKPFEMTVKEASPETLMCAYNKINGEYCSQNKWLLTDILRKEWGFGGLVMTDWGATHDRIKMLEAGLDLEMPGDNAICRKWILDAIESGELDEALLDRAVTNVLTLVANHESDSRRDADFAANHELAKRIAEDSAVLLENDGMLPLSYDGEYLVLGELFEKPRYQGSGSSLINPAYISSPKSAFDAARVKYTYSRGYRENSLTSDNELIKEALVKAESYENVIVFAGLTDYVESEGTDRADMRLPEGQRALIEALIKVGKRICVVLYGGSPAELPFADRVAAILNMYLPGQNGGEAMRSLLFGEVCPSGKLAESWPIEYSDIPFGESFGKNKSEVYKESVYVGYRYYLTSGVRVRYPFGYGLSYTAFKYSDMSVEENGDSYTVRCTVSNVGSMDGGEVVELYVGAPGLKAFAPLRELRGFRKVYLKAGESREVEIIVQRSELRYFNPKENRYVLEGGEYRFEICSDCESVKLSHTVEISGEDAVVAYSERVMNIYRNPTPDLITSDVFEEMSGIIIPPPTPKKPITLESRLSDLKATFMGRIIYKCVLQMAKKSLKKAKKMPEGAERENKIKGAIFLERSLNSNSLISISMSSGGRCPYNIAKGLMHLANGRLLRSIFCFLVPVRAPKLPKNQ